MPKWQLTTVVAPATETVAETFLWYRPSPKLQIGTALLWKQGSFRFLGNYELIPERARTPNLRVGFGVQGIGTGNPGYFATSEKSFRVKGGSVNAYVGVGFRSNENHGHLLGGIKYSPNGPWTLGLQDDGHDKHPFVTYSRRDWTVGFYLIGLRSPGLMFSIQR